MDAMREEMSALEKNKTWEIVDAPRGKNIVDCKWIFTVKYKADGSLETRQGWWPKGTLKLMELIIKRLLPQLLR